MGEGVGKRDSRVMILSVWASEDGLTDLGWVSPRQYAGWADILHEDVPSCCMEMMAADGAAGYGILSGCGAGYGTVQVCLGSIDRRHSLLVLVVVAVCKWV